MHSIINLLKMLLTLEHGGYQGGVSGRGKGDKTLGTTGSTKSRTLHHGRDKLPTAHVVIFGSRTIRRDCIHGAVGRRTDFSFGGQQT